jgi:hypothetical protein
VDWIRLSQDRDRWPAVVSAGMNLRVLAPRRLDLLFCRNVAAVTGGSFKKCE